MIFDMWGEMILKLDFYIYLNYYLYKRVELRYFLICRFGKFFYLSILDEKKLLRI